eukprot:scaffold21349_cov66-Phaeocystis_antarctica.AAC.2
MPLRPLGSPLELRWPAAAEVTDRNWLVFEHEGSPSPSPNSNEGRRLVLYSLEPHVVLELHGDGTTSLVAATSNAVFARRPHLAAAALHGGAAPLLIASAGGTPFYYAAVFHAKDRKLAYTNYAYTFEPRPPFRVLSVGRRPLRLRGERVRFVSGLARLGPFEEGDPLLGLSYGVDDRARCPPAHSPPEL